MLVLVIFIQYNSSDLVTYPSSVDIEPDLDTARSFILLNKDEGRDSQQISGH